jgi:hypothetical protein
MQCKHGFFGTKEYPTSCVNGWLKTKIIFIVLPHDVSNSMIIEGAQLGLLEIDKVRLVSANYLFNILLPGRIVKTPNILGHDLIVLHQLIHKNT